MTTEKLHSRIKSAAFLHKLEPKEVRFSTRPSSFDSQRHYFSEVPISESRFTINGVQAKENVQKRVISASRLLPLRTNPQTSSSIWRQVYSTRSQLRLNSLSNNSQESVRINLREKVQRIRSKHLQQEQVYQRCIKVISKKSLQRVRAIKQQGLTGDLHAKIMELIAPFELDKERAEERYRARLLRVKKG